MEDTTPAIDRRRWLIVLVGLLILALSALLIRLSLERAYAVDEFAYAHGAWLVAQGEIPTRDFFETKFLLPLWLFSTAFWLGGDDPHLIRVLRLLVLPFVALVAWSAGRLNRRFGPGLWLVGPLLVLSHPVLGNSLIEIRPDVLGVAFLLAGLVALDAEPASRWRAWLAGLLLGLCLWSTAKAALYGAPLAGFWILDVVRRRRGQPGWLFAGPGASALGVATVAAVVLAYLLVTGSAGAFVENTILHNQKFLVGTRWRSGWTDLAFLWQNALWIHLLAIVGVAATGRRLASGQSDPGRAQDVLLLALLPSTLASHLLQLYPYLYSLIPFMVIESFFAARGLVVAVLRVASWSRSAAGAATAAGASAIRPRFAAAALVSIGLCVGWGIARTGMLYASLAGMTSEAQHGLMSTIQEISEPGDPIYDNSALYVARPHAYFMPWTDRPIRQLWAERLTTEVPRAILERDCVIAVMDDRFSGLPPELRRFVAEHFRPYAGRVWLWARDFSVVEGRAEGRFLANRTGYYAVRPAEASTQGGLSIGGQPLSGAVVELEEGFHSVAYEGDVAAFRLQWLPPPQVDAAVVVEARRAEDVARPVAKRGG